MRIFDGTVYYAGNFHNNAVKYECGPDGGNYFNAGGGGIRHGYQYRHTDFSERYHTASDHEQRRGGG